MKRNIQKAPLFMAAASAVLMGTIGTISAYTQLGAETVTFYRLFLGGLMMFIFLALRGKLSLLLIFPSWQVLLNGVLLAGFIVFYIQAMHHTSMASAIMTIYLAPLAASLAAHFFFSERLNLWSVFMILTALTGFVLIMEFKLNFTSEGNSDMTRGLFFALVALICYAGFILVNRLVPDRIPVYTRSWYQLMTGALCMLPFMISQAEPVGAVQWFWLMSAGLFPGFLAILFAVSALQKLPAAIYGTLAYLEPITVVVLGWVLFGQSLNTMQIAGCLIIMGASLGQSFPLRLISN